MQLRIFGATDQGLVRTSNQDALFFSNEYGIVIVSDGMGGHKGGEIASNLVVTGLREAYLASTQILLENVGFFLDDVLRSINSEILKRGAEDEKLKGMGATVNYLQFAGGTVAIGHAGDSRTYLARTFCSGEGEVVAGLWQITIDHNVGNFIERGLIPKNSKTHKLTQRQLSRLTRGMGVMKDLKADLYIRNLMDRDVLMTCSDGLHGFVSDKDILEALCAGKLEDAPKRLIEKAKQAGAPDNVTVVISRWSEIAEPLQDKPTSYFPEHPFLVRMPNGTIIGPLEVERLIKKLILGEIPFDAEVNSRLNKWVFLWQTKLLFETYPEFDKAAVREFLSRMQPESIVSFPSTPNPVAERLERKKFYLSLLIGLIVILIVVIAILLYFTMMEYLVLQQTGI